MVARWWDSDSRHIVIIIARRSVLVNCWYHHHHHDHDQCNSRFAFGRTLTDSQWQYLGHPTNLLVPHKYPRYHWKKLVHTSTKNLTSIRSSKQHLESLETVFLSNITRIPVEVSEPSNPLLPHQYHSYHWKLISSCLYKLNS